jgi:uncharacterized membrane protein
MERSTLARVTPAERWDAEIDEAVNAAFLCGRHSTPEQDLEFAVRQMVEVAVRALSPAINDPFTAINCLDVLGSALCRVMRVGLPGSHRYDESGELRVVTPVTTFSGLADTAFNQIRQYGRQSVAVTLRMLEVIRECAEHVTAEEHRRTLVRHADMIYADAEAVIASENDRADIRIRWEAALRALDAPHRVPALLNGSRPRPV